MSLPPGFLDELRSRTSLADVVGKKVIWDNRKSNAAKGDLWAPCPFHQEKTASFHVDDRQGYYYCFGCHAKGDAISFVRETDNVGFMEAVEILAADAGLEMPARDPRAKERADRRTQLTDVMEMAVQHFRLQLKTGAASEARAYLSRRGLDESVRDRWELGFAADAWQGLWDHLTGKGIAADLILAAGLAKPSNKGGKPYDTFRNRIIYPIRDARGRVIAFGGRAMDPGDNAKYLNSPETELFDKGRSLYNHGPAREASGKGHPLVVAEGYMDVIALSEAGFPATVAPLGTAITEEQLKLLWRMAPEPVIALDGDTAGLRAAMRLIDLALPLIEAGQSLRFCILPEGQDPDDVIRAKGPEAMQALLESAQPMVRLLWQRETQGKVLDSPERRAALDKSLRAALSRITDSSIRGHYAQEIRRLREDLFGFSQGPRRAMGRGGQFRSTPTVTEAARGSFLAGTEDAAVIEIREAVVLATLLHTPALIEEYAYVLEELPFTRESHGEVARALLRLSGSETAGEAKETLQALLGDEALENLLTSRHVQVAPSVRSPGSVDLARLCLDEELAKLEAARGAAAEIAEAMVAIETSDDDDGTAAPLTWRLGEAARGVAVAGRIGEGDKAEFDIASNGSRLDPGERSAFAELLSQIGFDKPRTR